MPYNIRGFWFWWKKCPYCDKWIPDTDIIFIKHIEYMHFIYTPFEKPMPKTKYYYTTLDNYIVMPSLEQKYEELARFGNVFNIDDVIEITSMTEEKPTEKNNYPSREIEVKGHEKPIFVLERGVLFQLNKVQGEITPKDPLKVRVATYIDRKGNTSLTIKNV